MTHGSLFSGIGGFDLAAEWMGWENVFHCEIAEFPRKILKYHFPKSICYEDIKKTDFTKHKGEIDIISGGFPCQPYSNAGKRKGKEDDRHLWPEMLRVIREVQPRFVVGENVSGLLTWNNGMVFHEIIADLENEGYETQAFLIPACATNAPHRRDRIWFVAHANNTRTNERVQFNGKGEENDKQWRGQSQFEYWKNGSDGITSHSNGTEQRNDIGENIREEGKIRWGKEGDVFGELRGDGITTDTDNGSGLRNTVQTRRTEFEELYDSPSNVADSGNKGLERAASQRIQRNERGISKIFNGKSTWFNKQDSWQNFPTQSPVCGGDDGIFTKSHGITISENRNNMDRNLVTKLCLEEGRLKVDFKTGKIYSLKQRGCEGESIELKGSDCNGYIVHGIRYNGFKIQLRAHQIVWIAANGIYDKSSFMIDHINRNKKDNRLENLRLVDAKGNAENATRYSGKLTQDQKDLMVWLHKEDGIPIRELAEDFEISKSRVHQIISEHSGIYGITFSKWRNESIKGYGNAVVPQVVYQIFKAIEQSIL